MMKLTKASCVSLCLVGIAFSRPHPNVKRDVAALRDSYDFVIAGGGIVGLTVADRLSAAFPNKTVLVIEYGENKYAAGSFDPPATSFGVPKNTANVTGTSTPTSFAVPALPLKAVDYRVGSVTVGKGVGGGSTINGQYMDRGSRFDYDAWAAAGGAGFESWNWDGLFPYFRKSMTFTPPPASSVAKHGYTWDASAWDNSTPVHASFPPFQWGDFPIGRAAWKEMGIAERKECALGDKDGICWTPIAQNPITARRSHAGIAHYDEVRRPNYDLLVLHQAIRVVYPRGHCSGPPVLEVKSLADDRIFNVTANAEVILSAGALHTPTILQRSGIGQKAFLDQQNIETIANLPGVGANYQDHWSTDISWKYSDPVKFAAEHYPLPAEMNNKTFFDDAVAGFDEVPARGPYTLAQAQSAIYVSLPKVTADYGTIVAKIRAQVALAATFLPADLASEPSIVAGYAKQLNLIADMHANAHMPSIETTFATGTILKLIALHPVSRGTVRVNMSDPLGNPILDTRLATNPVDMDLHVAHLRWMRSNFLQTKTMRDLGALATDPPDSLDNSDDEAMKAWIRRTASLSVAHPCCTAAMMPRDLGGVVNASLKVYGVSGLRVADLSAMPLLVSAHLSTTAYAFGEKAASIIIKEWSSK